MPGSVARGIANGFGDILRREGGSLPLHRFSALPEIRGRGAFKIAIPAARLAQTGESSAQDNPVAPPGLDEVNAQPIPAFDSGDRAARQFGGSLEYRSGLSNLAVSARRFGGLSGLRLDAKGERFIAISDKGSWFTGRIVYQGREMTGLADVEAAPMLGPDGRPITARAAG